MKITTPNLNINTFEDVFYKINAYILTTPENKNLNIDISNIKFVDPYSIINLCMLFRYLKKYSFSVSLILPQDANVNSYLERINFFDNIPRETKLSTIPPSKKKFLPSDVLLELTAIQKQSDVNNVIKYSITKIGRILQTSLGYTEKDIASFCTALSETCQNIIDHSKDEGLVCVQKYHGAPRVNTRGHDWYDPAGRHPERAFIPGFTSGIFQRRDKNSNYVIIAVSDLGIGIKKSLANRYNVTAWNHAKAIQNALQLGISRLQDRGKGLYIVNEIARKYNGKLIIRSCSGRVDTGTIANHSIVPYFPGTQIYIKL